KKKEEGDGSGIYAGACIQATAGMNTGKVNHLVRIGKEETNGQRYNTAAKNIKAMYQATTELNEKNSLSWLGGYIDNEFGANGYYAAPHDKESYELVKTIFLRMSYNYQRTDN